MTKDSYSLSARVYESIREDIFSGKYKKDEELKEKTIGDELGVSRTPVREALKQLELEGLIAFVPNKGASVIGVSLEDIKDIYEIRAHLEGLCARWAAVNITDEQMKELEENIDLTEFYKAKHNYDQSLKLDNRFHEILYEASGSRELKRVLKEYHLYLQRVRKVSLKNEQRASASMQEHKMIAEAIKKHDADSAEMFAKNHIISTMSNMDKFGWENLIK